MLSTATTVSRIQIIFGAPARSFVAPALESELCPLVGESEKLRTRYGASGVLYLRCDFYYEYL